MKNKFLSAKDLSNIGEELITPQIIKNIRKNYNLTQDAFSDLLGVKYNTYRSWEGGYKNPSSPAIALLQIAKKFPKIFLQNRKEILNFVRNNYF